MKYFWKPTAETGTNVIPGGAGGIEQVVSIDSSDISKCVYIIHAFACGATASCALFCSLFFGDLHVQHLCRCSQDMERTTCRVIAVHRLSVNDDRRETGVLMFAAHASRVKILSADLHYRQVVLQYKSRQWMCLQFACNKSAT